MEESYIDIKLAENKDTSNRQFLRSMNELALALHIQSVNSKRWPAVVTNEGSVDPEAVAIRIRNVKRLSSPIFNLLTQNLGWFVDRVNDALTMEALGNG